MAQNRRDRTNPVINMQYPFSLTLPAMASIEATLSSARLARFLPEAKGNRQLAIRLHVWNARLCESFYLPAQFAEVAARNAIQKPVVRRFSSQWYENRAFQNILPPRLEEELIRVVSEEQRARGMSFTVDHVVAALSFGFWLNLLTSSYEKHLWAIGLRGSFPHLPGTLKREDVYKALDQLRRFRNKIAHHSAIFDKRPRAEHANVLEVIGWICSDTRWLVSELTYFERVLGRKPRSV
ncbi:MAG TPA: hypothetical protein VHW66_21495 [Stellaceae bacterium]|nr:hypothetical protein [Stellaceae bacterium]